MRITQEQCVQLLDDNGDRIEMEQVRLSAARERHDTLTAGDSELRVMQLQATRAHMWGWLQEARANDGIYDTNAS